MKLIFSQIGLEAGRPIAFLHKESAKRMRVSEGDRIEIKYKGKKLILISNIVSKVLKPNRIALSAEACEILKPKSGEEIDVGVAVSPESTFAILKKLDRKKLDKKEIGLIIEDIVNNSLTEAEIAYFVSGVYQNGMDLEETCDLTEAVFRSGRKLKWNSKIVADKHSIGGVAGNRTTPIVISICAAAGVIMPKTSSRAITSAAGTADTIETIANVELSENELMKVVEKTNACLAWGGSLGLAPADDKLIRVERLLNVDPEPQLLASILGKKLAAGSTHVLIDIPAGKGAKVSEKKAKDLAEKFRKIGDHFGLHIEVVITNGSSPIGKGIGPILEMKDVIAVLERKDGPRDLEEKSIFLSGKILEMVGKSKKGSGEKLAREILESGKALRKFEEIINAQGKKKEIGKEGSFSKKVFAAKSGKIAHIDNQKINLVARVLGCPVNSGAGVLLRRRIGDRVQEGDEVMEIFAESRGKLLAGLKLIERISPIEI